MGEFAIIGVTNDILKSLLFLSLKEVFNINFSLREVEQKIVNSELRRISGVENFEYRKLVTVFKIFLGEPRETTYVERKAGDPIIECLP